MMGSMRSRMSWVRRRTEALMRMTASEIGKREIWLIRELMGRIGECESNGENDLNRPYRLGKPGGSIILMRLARTLLESFFARVNMVGLRFGLIS
jgi:hypothetical protein